VYLPLIVNGEFFHVLYLYHTQKNSELDAGDRFELPMHRAYETGVVASLPAVIIYLFWNTLLETIKSPYKYYGFECVLE